MTPRAIPLNLFGIPFGLAGLAGAWLAGAEYRLTPQVVGDMLLPTVAGGLLAAAAAAKVGQARLGEAMFGLGSICWLVLGSIIMGRLLLRPMLPRALQPTLAIEVAPAAVGSLAHFALYGDRVDWAIAFLGGCGLLMALAQLRLLPEFLELPFMPSQRRAACGGRGGGHLQRRPDRHQRWEVTPCAQ